MSDWIIRTIRELVHVRQTRGAKEMEDVCAQAMKCMNYGFMFDVMTDSFFKSFIFHVDCNYGSLGPTILCLTAF